MKPTAIVTGAGSGIGRATAIDLAQAGYRVALVGRTSSRLEEVAKEISPANTLVVPADVSIEADVQAMIEHVHAAWNRIDVLVNNAGAAPMMPLADMPTSTWKEMLDTNLSSVFYAIKAVWPIMQINGGVIVNISSAAARDPFPGLGAYGAAKLGVHMLTLAAAREGAPHRIRVHCVAPAAVDTSMLRAVIAPQVPDPAHVMQPIDLAKVIRSIVDGTLAHTSGETIYLHRSPA